MEPTTFTALKAMEQLGYVERRQHADNRKNVYVFLTPKGRALKEKLVPLAEDVNRIAVAGSIREVTRIRRLLAVIENLARDEEDPDRPPRALDARAGAAGERRQGRRARREHRRIVGLAREARRAAAALALRPHPVVPAQVPVLRLQLAREARRAARGASTSTRSSPTSSASLADGVGTAHPHDLHRRRHAEPLRAGGDRSPAHRGAHAPAARPRRRDHDGGESRAPSRPSASAAIATAGVNRLSIGVQSFDDAKLAALGRVHGADEARRALAAALAIFPTVNVDLMYALPGQTLEGALADVREAVASGAPHVSAYHLTLEPDTHFHRFPPQLPDDDAAADMQEAIEALLAAAGYGHYETSAFAQPGHRARHNLNYWTFGDYLGIGAGAHGKISFRDRIAARGARSASPRPTSRAALAGDADPRIARGRRRDELPFEFMLNALRLVEGFPDRALRASARGLPITAVERELARAEARGLIERDHATIRPTREGAALPERPAGALPARRAARSAPRRVISICFAGYAPSLMNGGSRPTSVSSMISSSSVWFGTAPGSARMMPPSSRSSSGCLVVLGLHRLRLPCSGPRPAPRRSRGRSTRRSASTSMYAPVPRMPIVAVAALIATGFFENTESTAPAGDQHVGEHAAAALAPR